jgi:hypothetical protein
MASPVCMVHNLAVVSEEAARKQGFLWLTDELLENRTVVNCKPYQLSDKRRLLRTHSPKPSVDGLTSRSLRVSGTHSEIQYENKLES